MGSVESIWGSAAAPELESDIFLSISGVPARDRIGFGAGTPAEAGAHDGCVTNVVHASFSCKRTVYLSAKTSSCRSLVPKVLDGTHSAT